MHKTGLNGSEKIADNFFSIQHHLNCKFLQRNFNVHKMPTRMIFRTHGPGLFFEKWCHGPKEKGNFRHSVLDMISCGSILFYFQREILNLASSLVKIEPKHTPFFRKVSKQRDRTINIYFCFLARVLMCIFHLSLSN